VHLLSVYFVTPPGGTGFIENMGIQIDTWLSESMNEWTDDLMDERTTEHMNSFTNERLNERTNELMKAKSWFIDAVLLCCCAVAPLRRCAVYCTIVLVGRCNGVNLQ
jgi:hypothetical protein